MDKYIASRIAAGARSDRPEPRIREPVVALHCSVASAGQWRPLGKALGARYQVIAPGFYGGGSTGPWPGDRAFSLEAEARRIVAVLDGLDGPAHLVGHSYGGAVALEAARARPDLVASLSLYEPASFHLLRKLGGRAAAERVEIATVTGAVCAGLVNGSYQTAAAAFVDYWKGAGTWESLWPEARERLIDGLPRAALDLLALTEHEMPDAAYGRIRCPALIVRGEHARGPSRLIAEELARRLPSALLEVVPGAAHMGPITHPGDVNGLIAACIRANPARAAEHTGATLIAA